MQPRPTEYEVSCHPGRFGPSRGGYFGYLEHRPTSAASESHWQSPWRLCYGAPRCTTLQAAIGTGNVQRLGQLPLTSMLIVSSDRLHFDYCGGAMALCGRKLLVADTGGDRVVVLAAISLELLCV